MPEAARLAPSVRSEHGQASVDLVAAAPLVLLAGLIAWQLALAGHAAWMCAHAARAAARADAVGADPRRAARSALPRSLERGLRVERPGAGRVVVRVRIPAALPGLGSPVTVAAAAGLGARR